MEWFIKSLIASIMLGISCKEYYGAILPERKMKYGWIGKTRIPALITGFMVISITPIPPYVLQPVRLVVIVFMIAQIYFEVKWIYNLALSVFFCGIVWTITAVVISILQMLPLDQNAIEHISDPIWCGILLFLMLIFSYKFKGKMNFLNNGRWIYFGLFPLFSIIALMIMMTWDGRSIAYDIRFLGITGFGVANILIFYFICSILIRDSRMQNMRVENELVRNQMDLYRNMEQNYRRQQKYMHDYKNQLNCISGLLEKEQIEEALGYIEELTGGIRKSTDYVDTNHVIVNVILNQKYQYAQENGITMVISVNDLSRLTMKKEELVILLSNLLDNAIEACRETDVNKVIRFKMIMEEENLILSVKNPMKTPVKRKGKRILSSKKDPGNHGIGLTNIESVVRKNHGVSSINCENDSFFFSAMIPNGQGGFQ